MFCQKLRINYCHQYILWTLWMIESVYICVKKGNNHLSFKDSVMTSNERMVITCKIGNHFARVFSDACKFVFWRSRVHACTPGAITSAADKMCGGTRFQSGNGFLMFILNHICRVHRPKWAFERWFIIRVGARTKSPARFHCSRIFLNRWESSSTPLVVI